MDYYFKIADIKIHIESEVPIAWNSYIQAFACESNEACKEHYICRFSDELVAEGIPVYQDSFQRICQNGPYEERLHFFWGQGMPCILYKEYTDKKVLLLNRLYQESFLRKDNYSIFNALALEKVLLKHRAIVLHSAFIVWKGHAVLFTAPSGTGKSTQAALWKKYRDALIVNGDRTILRKKEGKYYACGIPVCGSSDICLNMEVPLRAIVYLSQSKENLVEEIGVKERIKYLLSETTISFFNKDFFEEAFEIISDISEGAQMFHQYCTPDKTAVKVLAEQLGEGKAQEKE